jgi:purine-nucleoside/S-methyl-5'-thioadenosine phosphorylase / adenosine deaminase
VTADRLSRALPGRGHTLFTTRAAGNLSSVGGAGARHGDAARERLRREIGVERIVRGHQVHGAVVRRVRAAGGASHHGSGALQGGSKGRGPEEAGARGCDGGATALTGLAVAVLTADCLPVALGAPNAVAMLHAGWRGLAAGVLEEGVAAITELGGPEQIVAVIGPGAGVCCYEVGDEVHEALGGAHRRGRRIDLRAIARERLIDAGVWRVKDVPACTICDRRFFSHRREGAGAGRQGGVAWLS